MGELNGGLLRHLGKYEIPKPNQEEEQKEIEKILKEEFNIVGNVIIFGHDLKDFGARYPLKYDCMIIEYERESLDSVFDMHLNGRFEKYGIKNFSSVCKGA